ncbi:hypothetical protein LR48_Vigan10g029100 [Vigna angularis]|uniref:Uncharacterized protein n=1 Tax=Phaseolus angularis TaxID=3914 RepID=A0A0L9VI69_PHAAN|nr:hypothetical protein LR48_Vigan10g029100 [Vigna angularis]
MVLRLECIYTVHSILKHTHTSRFAQQRRPKASCTVHRPAISKRERCLGKREHHVEQPSLFSKRSSSKKTHCSWCKKSHGWMEQLEGREFPPCNGNGWIPAEMTHGLPHPEALELHYEGSCTIQQEDPTSTTEKLLHLPFGMNGRGYADGAAGSTSFVNSSMLGLSDERNPPADNQADSPTVENSYRILEDSEDEAVAINVDFTGDGMEEFKVNFLKVAILEAGRSHFYFSDDQPKFPFYWISCPKVLHDARRVGSDQQAKSVMGYLGSKNLHNRMFDYLPVMDQGNNNTFSRMMARKQEELKKYGEGCSSRSPITPNPVIVQNPPIDLEVQTAAFARQAETIPISSAPTQKKKKNKRKAARPKSMDEASNMAYELVARSSIYMAYAADRRKVVASAITECNLFYQMPLENPCYEVMQTVVEGKLVPLTPSPETQPLVAPFVEPQQIVVEVIEEAKGENT